MHMDHCFSALSRAREPSDLFTNRTMLHDAGIDQNTLAASVLVTDCRALPVPGNSRTDGPTLFS